MSQKLQTPKRESPRWYEDVKKRDNYECQHCGIKKGEDEGVYNRLEAHHIFYFAQYHSLTNGHNLNNGITLCHKCHMAYHNWNDKPTQYYMNRYDKSNDHVKISDYTHHHYKNIESFWEKMDEIRFEKLLIQYLRGYINSDDYVKFIEEKDDSNDSRWGTEWMKWDDWVKERQSGDNYTPEHLANKFMNERYDSCGKCLRDVWNCMCRFENS